MAKRKEEPTALQKATAAASKPPAKVSPPPADNGPPARKPAAAADARKAAQAAAQYVPTPEPPEPLFPVRLPVVLLSGPPDAGKTLAAVLLDPGRTLYLDTEKSAEPYAEPYGVGEWVDVAAATAFSAGRATPEAMFSWLKTYISTVPSYSPEKPDEGHRVCVLDTADIIEDGIANTVAADTKKYRLPTDDVSKINQLFWSAVKGVWRAVLVDMIARFETTIIITHQKEEYRGKQPTGKMIPGGKDTLVKLASLVLMLSRPTSAKTGTPVDKPFARLVKGRISIPWRDPATGEVVPRRVVPPQVSKFTFGKLRWYMHNPPDFDALPSEEKVPEDTLSPDERLRLRAATAQAVAEAERLKAERETRHEDWRREQIAGAAARAKKPEPEAPKTPEDLLREAVDEDIVSQEELEALARLKEEAAAAGLSKAKWVALVRHHNIDPDDLESAKSSDVQALIRYLAYRLDLAAMYTDLYGEPEEDGDESEDAPPKNDEEE